MGDQICVPSRGTFDPSISYRKMVAEYLCGGMVTSLLGFLFLFLFLLRLQRKTRGWDAGARAVAANVFDSEDFTAGDTDVIIVGAGVAGSALAYTLGKDGRRVLVIERDLTEPDRIVGEYLQPGMQPGGYLKLRELGLEDCIEEIDAQRVLGYALFKDGNHTKIPYPLEKYDYNVSGKGFHNGRFVQKMRKKASSLPKVKLEQGTVTSLVQINGIVKGVVYKTAAGEELKALAPLTIVCDGCFSNLRRSLCSPKVPIQLYDAFVSAINRGSIRTMPNKNMPAAPHRTPGALLLGDAFNMRLALTGGGMTVALSDIVVLRNLLKPVHNLHDTIYLCKYLESFYTLRKPLSSTINTLACALSKVFSASTDQARNEMRQACFDYLSLGGVFSTGPVALLSGLNPQPLSLIAHFFAVAIYGVGRVLLPFPSPQWFWIGARLVLGASSIIFPIIKAEGVRQMFFPATLPSYYGAPPTKTELSKIWKARGLPDHNAIESSANDLTTSKGTYSEYLSYIEHTLMSSFL